MCRESLLAVFFDQGDSSAGSSLAEFFGVVRGFPECGKAALTETERTTPEAMIQVPGNSRSTVLVASPHHYPDLARLWYRFVSRDLRPAFARLDLHFQVNIFRDANASRFDPQLFPGVVFSKVGPGMRDFIEFYDAALRQECDFLFFADADLFFLNGEWIASYFKAFRDPTVAAVSFVPRKGAPAIFALLCRSEAYRTLPTPVFACRYEHPEIWPHGINLQPGEFAARELSKRGMKILNVDAAESSEYIAMFRSTTGIRTTREHIVRVSGEQAFQTYVARNPAYIAAAYDNILLGALYESLFAESFRGGLLRNAFGRQHDATRTEPHPRSR